MGTSRSEGAVQISGRALLGLLSYARELGGPDGRGALVSSLPEEGRRLFGARVRASAWYPYEIYALLLQAIDGWPGRSEGDPMATLGHWGLRRDAGNVLRILSVFSSPEGLVHRGFGSWGAFLWGRHCNAGEVFLASGGPGFGSMGIRNFPEVDPRHCRMTTGYLEEMGRAVGAKDMRMREVRCVHRGDGLCEFRGEWSP